MKIDTRTKIRFLVENMLPSLGIRERLDDTEGGLALWKFDAFIQDAEANTVRVFWKAIQVSENSDMDYVEIPCGVFQDTQPALIADAFVRSVIDIQIRSSLQSAVDKMEKQFPSSSP